MRAHGEKLVKVFFPKKKIPAILYSQKTHLFDFYLNPCRVCSWLYTYFIYMYNVHIYSGPYLIVASDNSLVGSIDGHAVYSITSFDVIPFSKSTIHLSYGQVRMFMTSIKSYSTECTVLYM